MSESLSDRGFRIAHQKVSIDVDLASVTVRGWTELTVVPTDPLLKSLKLDSRHSTIHNVLVNGKKATFAHLDALSNATLYPSASIHQHHIYERQIEDLLSDTLPGELSIQLPKGTRILPQDDPSTTLSLASLSRSSPDMMLYQPLTVKVDFSTSGTTSGLRFVGGAKSNLKKTFWHSYTTHEPLGQATSSWLPCVDGLWELCTWEMEVSVPRTVGELVPNEQNGSVKPDAEPQKDEQEGMEVDESEVTDQHDAKADDSVPRDDGSKDAETTEPAETSEEDEREIIVVCNSSTPEEVVHPFDETKKVVSFQIFTPVSAHHIGFAVGAFVATPISDLRRQSDGLDVEASNGNDADADTSSEGVPIVAYTFPDKVVEVTNSCVFLYKAMEFFTREYGSYPFSMFSLCFVSEAPSDVASAASLAICSDKLLFPPEVIEPLFTNAETLTVALAAQWVGVNIVPRTWNDIWLTIGLSYFMAALFLRKLLGNNEYRFRLKQRAEEVCRHDIDKPPLANPHFLFPIVDKDLSFIRLKAPAILFILDRRMTKTDRSLGLSRVLPKLFLQSMSGDLNSCLSTQHFMKLCERVGHSRLEQFFDQWIYGSGYPIFRVTQRFNKKRMFIEMGIRQVQAAELSRATLDESSFVDDAVKRLDGFTPSPPQAVFTGPMTIRIHEADGTPYEHVVDLKESFTKLDIQYNTKYKRLRRNQRPRGAPGGASAASGGPVAPVDADIGSDDEGGNAAGVLLHCLGDVLQTDRDAAEWRLTDWNTDDEEHMYNEAFEWMRVDADFEWICRIYVNQPDYMYASQLQQDRDVVAQYEAVRYFGDMKPSLLFSTILVRTLMDRRYYYGVRVQAAHALTKTAVRETDYAGQFHLLKAFQEMFCFEGSTIPSANDFSDFPTYFVQKAITQALARIRDPVGNCPMEVKRFLVDLLRYNENSSNPFSDCYYVCNLIQAICTSLKPFNEHGIPSNEDGELAKFVDLAVSEIDRCQRMDRWIPSIYNVVTRTAIEQKTSLLRYGYDVSVLEELIQYTRPGNNPDVRLAAFRSILTVGGLKNEQLLNYLFLVMVHDPSAYVQRGLVEVLCDVIGSVALYGDASDIVAKLGNGGMNGGGEVKKEASGPVVVVEEATTGLSAARREALARSTLSGAMDLVRGHAEKCRALKHNLRTVLVDRRIGSVVEKRRLLEVSRVLYKPVDSYMVKLPLPRRERLVAKSVGNGLVIVKLARVLESDVKADKAKPKPKKPRISLVNGGKPEVRKVKLKLKLGG